MTVTLAPLRVGASERLVVWIRDNIEVKYHDVCRFIYEEDNLWSYGDFQGFACIAGPTSPRYRVKFMMAKQHVSTSSVICHASV